MGSIPRIIEARADLDKVTARTQQDPLDDQVTWYLDRIFGKTRVNGSFVLALLSTMDEDGPALVATALQKAIGRSFPDSSSRTLYNAIEEYLEHPTGPEPVASELAISDPAGSEPGGPALSTLTSLFTPATPATSGSNPGAAALSRAAALVEQAVFGVFQQVHGGHRLAEPLDAPESRAVQIFGLTQVEAAILSFLYTLSERSDLATYLDGLTTHGYRSCLAAIVGVPLQEIKTLLAQGGRLVTMGFVQPDFFPPPYYSLGPDIAELYRNPASSPSYAQPLEEYIRDSACQCFPLDSYPIAPISRELFSAFLSSQSGHILVHGQPGTGKSSFVASAIRQSGRAAFVLKLLGGTKDSAPDHLRLRMAVFLCAGSSSVLVIDEADSLINTNSTKPGEASVSKAWLTEFMDDTSAPVIWITNDIEGMHEAVRRRFLYSLRFRDQTDTQRGLVWRRLAGSYGAGTFLNEGEIDRLAKDYRVNASGIDLALRGLDQAAKAGVMGGQPDIKHLAELLTRYQALVHGEESLPAAGVAAQARFVPEAICTDLPLGRILAGLRGVAVRVRTRVELEAAGAPVPEELREGTEAKLLFHGPPGTGKTAYARYIARELGLPLVQKRASDLLSMFVGQTEKAIATIFAEAEAQGALLFLDEVDSLLSDRRSARESWERTQVNELLSRMEDYRGALVCCTNFMEGLDPAVLRRFQWKVAFQPPVAEARLLLYRRYFEELAGPLSPADEARVLAMEGLCPGDLAAVHRALAPFRLEDQGPSAAHAEVATMLEAELKVHATGQHRVLGLAN